MAHIKLYLPKTANNYSAALTHVKRQMAGTYGGFTAYDGQGGWVDDDGELIEEPVTIIESVSNGSRTGAEDFALTLARSVKHKTGEESVMAMVDDKKILAMQ